MLGALGLGDLGDHFPPGDERWRDANSAMLLGRIVEMVSERGFHTVNCDLTLIGEEPRLAPYRDAIRVRISEVLGVEPACVGVKATTNEGMGALGRGEGLAALAVVLLEDGND
jgi:2-C-methyl-D-erythritol 2,4-cyclodiphosphate synthase